MERSRLPSPCKKMIRHSPRKQTCGRGRGYVYAFIISLLLFCMLAIFHSKLGAVSSANASHVARFFTSPISQQEGKSFKISSASLHSVSLKNETFARDVVETKLDNSRADNGSLPLGQEEEEDEDEDTEVQEEEEEEENAEDGEEQEEDDGEEEAGLEHDTRKLKDVRRLHDTALNSSTHALDKVVLGSTSLLSSANNGEVLTELVNDSERAQVQTQAKKSLLKLGGIKTLSRWDPLEDMGGRSKADYTQRGSGQPLDKNESSRWHGVMWDHLLGVIRKIDTAKGSTTQFPSRKVEPGAPHSIHVLHEVNQSDSSSSHSTQTFGSDDEPSDQSVIGKLEEITTIEDALLLKGRNAFIRLWAERKPNKGDAFKKDRTNKAFYDPLNPMNNPLLQDPDTFGSGGLSGSDKVMLKALQRGKQEPACRNADTALVRKVSEDTLATNRNGTSTHDIVIDAGVQLGNGAERSILELSSSGSFIPSKVVEKEGIVGRLLSRKLSIESDSGKEKHISSMRKSSLDTRRWGFYPTLDPNLGFSEFMDQFLGDKSCSHKVFMVWTTPPWTYTVRYQRGLESLLYFHPKACVVVFSESIELDFFKSFVDDGFSVAVVVPNLEELLDGTPAAMFASFWLSWRKTHLFYIHYSELLRLAALYKYGGIYLDSDVILLKPLGLLHNTIGAHTVENQTQKLNGAVMAFDKSSLFLLECLVEFMETYDDQLLDFNGAGLVTRVAKRIIEEQSRNSEQGTGDLYVEQPYAFFPLSSELITRFFKAPDSKKQQLETDLLFESIYNRSSMLHFWNQKTHGLVPESCSLVERIINHHCIKCYEYL